MAEFIRPTYDARTMPATDALNGMPEFTGYVYRGAGKDTLTGHIPDAELIKADVAWRRSHRPVCPACGYAAGGRNCKRRCG